MPPSLLFRLPPKTHSVIQSFSYSILQSEHSPNAKRDAFGGEAARFAKEKRVVEPVVLAVAWRFELGCAAEVEVGRAVGVLAGYNQAAVADVDEDAVVGFD